MPQGRKLEQMVHGVHIECLHFGLGIKSYWDSISSFQGFVLLSEMNTCALQNNFKPLYSWLQLQYRLDLEAADISSTIFLVCKVYANVPIFKTELKTQI